jgi:hypothetical protein
MDEEQYQLSEEAALMMKDILSNAEKLGLIGPVNKIKSEDIRDICHNLAMQNQLWLETDISNKEERVILLGFALLSLVDFNKKLN